MKTAPLPFLHLAAAIAAASLFSSSARAQTGALLVAPTRVVLEGRDRTAEVVLVNTGSEPATYRLSLIHIRMTESGSTRQVEEAGPGELFADELIRFSPRQVTLAPRESQTVRLQVRKPAELPAGEYRSHLLFRAVGGQDTARDPQAPSPELSVQLRPIYGVSIPVIVRHGETSAAVTLASARLMPPEAPGEPPQLEIAVERTGNCSVYGDFTVREERTSKKPLVAGELKGLAVYTPNARRLVHVPLRGLDEPTPRGRLSVTYTEQGKKKVLLAETRLEPR